MHIVSFKVTKTKGIFILIVVFLLVVGCIWGIETIARRHNERDVKAWSGLTNAERLEFIAQFGWMVGEEPCEVVETQIPEKFDEVLVEYNALQLAQGYDLQPYCGQQVKRYTYEVLNYPDHPEHIRLDLLVYDGKIIGGDVCSIELDGFMHGFAKDK